MPSNLPHTASPTLEPASSSATARGMLRYTRPAMILHWLMAVLIVCGLILGLSMVELPVSPKKLQWYSYHKWLGITTLCLACLRLLWRISHAPPPAPAGMPLWQKLAASWAHWALYLLIFAIPLSGWMFSSASGFPVVYLGIKALRLPDLVDRSKELAQLLRWVHAWLNYALLVLLLAHVAAAFKHHCFDRDEVLWRMTPIPFRGRGAGASTLKRPAADILED
ncbi:cytochrome b [Hydrocarboniphaga sp.]|uniref:cytochrome b n=1 Tax=Hydrocarboniphaga sp. TaxID=2033016 RepID=UPI003D0DE7CB